LILVLESSNGLPVCPYRKLDLGKIGEEPGACRFEVWGGLVRYNTTQLQAERQLERPAEGERMPSALG
jgi:hypothetical protein